MRLFFACDPKESRRVKSVSYVLAGKGYVMTLNELLMTIGVNEAEKGENEADKTARRKVERISRKKLLESKMSVIVEEKIYEGDIIVYENGMVLYEDMGNYTIFSVEDCLSYTYSSIDVREGITDKEVPYMHSEYDLSYLKELDWAVAITFIGMDRIEENRSKRNYYTPLENITYDGTMDYDRIKDETRRNRDSLYGVEDFSDDVDRRIDVENIMSGITELQQDVLHARYWEDKKFVDIGMKYDGTSVYAKQRAKDSHDRGIKKIRKKIGDSMDNYRE